MARKKLARFEAVHASPYVLEYPLDDLSKEVARFLKPRRPFLLELGCGRGEYTLALAQLTPNAQVIGVDVQGERLWFAVQALAEHPLPHVRFLRLPVEKLGDVLPAHSVDEIWVTFPDPYPGRSRAKRRLTSEPFLSRYKHYLKPGGFLHLKTDVLNVARFSKETAEKAGWKVLDYSEDIDTTHPDNETLKTRTHYETKHRNLGKKICYLKIAYM